MFIWNASGTNELPRIRLETGLLGYFGYTKPFMICQSRNMPDAESSLCAFKRESSFSSTN